MSIAIALRFPAGRFHATPWGHHVNEGVPEWPPSPWRLLRALVATWKRKLPSEPGVSNHVESLLTKLAVEPPAFALPSATLGHTRHFMPLKFPDRGERTKVFDAFVAVDPEQDVVIHWADGSLSEDERRTLSLLLSQLGYFGRAESWCSARLLTDFDPERVNCRPGKAEAGYETVRVLGPNPKDWKVWSFKTRTPPEPPWNLLAETADLHAPSEKWSDPPGSRWLTYTRRSDCFTVKPSGSQSPAVEERSRFTVARFVLDVSEGKRPLPLFTEAVPFAEAVRASLLGCYQRLRNRRAVHSESLSGKHQAGGCLKSHGHAFYLPTAEERNGTRIDHLTIHVPVGFTRDEIRALDEFRSLQFREAEYRLLLTGLGTRHDFHCPLFAESRTWASATPFVVTRHLKRRGTKKDDPTLFGPAGTIPFLQKVLLENWGQREDLLQRSPAPHEVDPLDAGTMAFRPLQFYRGRKRPGDDGFGRAFGALRLKFLVPVSGPLCLGYACHFGLGMFLPETASRATQFGSS